MDAVGEQRQAAGDRCPGAGDVELADVLLSDVGVRADVDDVDTLDAVLHEAFDRLRDDPARDQRLPEPDLVGDEEALRGVGRVEQPCEGMLDRRPLEVFETGEDRRGVEGRAHGRLPLTAVTVAHSSSSSGGSRSAVEPPAVRMSAKSRSISSRRSGVR